MQAPVIKWPGSKRKIADQLAKLVPAHERYYEPFIGGGAMLAQARPKAGLVSDIIPQLMDLWTLIRDEPEKASSGYSQHWQNLQAIGYQYFYTVREHFNKTGDPVALLFLSRTCVNGLIRFNSKGEFNNSLHHTRPGIQPDSLKKIIGQWTIHVSNLEIRACDYREALSAADSGDFAFLDPPYVGTKGRYLPGQFDFVEFYETLDNLTKRGVKWLLTLDGSAGSREYTSSSKHIPATHSFRISTGHSPFTRLMKTSLDAVFETVYLNYQP